MASGAGAPARGPLPGPRRRAPACLRPAARRMVGGVQRRPGRVHRRRRDRSRDRPLSRRREGDGSPSRRAVRPRLDARERQGGALPPVPGHAGWNDSLGMGRLSPPVDRNLSPNEDFRHVCRARGGRERGRRHARGRRLCRRAGDDRRGGRARGAHSARDPLHARAGAAARRHRAHDDLLYVVAGSGRVEVLASSYPLAAGTAVHLRAGDSYVVENTGTDDLVVVVSVLVPPSPGADGPIRCASRSCASRNGRSSGRTPSAPTGAVRRGHRVPDGDAVRGLRRAVPCAGSQPPLRRGRLRPRGHGLAHMGGEPVPIGPARASICRPSTCTASRTPARRDEDPRRLPSRRSPAARSYDAAADAAAQRRFCPVETSINALKEGTE